MRAGVRTAVMGAFVIFALVAVVEGVMTSMAKETREWVTRTNEGIRELLLLRVAELEANSTRRDYLLSGDRSLRAQYQRASGAAHRHLSNARVLIDETPTQTPRLAETASLLEAAAALGEASFRDLGAARAHAANTKEETEGAQRMRDVLDAIIAEENDLLVARERKRASLARAARSVEAIGSLAGLTLLWFVFRRLDREVEPRKRSERNLRESEERLGTTLDSIGDGVITTDAKGLVTRMNPIAEKLTEWSRADAIGRPFSQIFHTIDEETGVQADDPVSRVLRDGTTIGLSHSTALISKNGTVRAVADSAAPIRDMDGALVGVVMVFRDRTEEREAERRIRDTTAFLDSMVENLPNMVFVKDAAELRFVRFNRAGEELLGVERGALIGKNDYDIVPKEQADFFQEKDRLVLAGGTLVDIPEEPIETPQGRRWLHTKKIPILDDGGKPRFLLGISEDITERKASAEKLAEINAELERRVEARTHELVVANAALTRQIRERRQAEAALELSEQQLRQSQKMEAIGRLAGGVAHDFNNLLSVILSYAELIGMNLPEDSPVEPELQEIRRAGERAADLTRQLLAFSRRQILVPKIVDLNASIESMRKMLRRVIGEDVDLLTLPYRELAKVRVDPGQMEQVIMNLVVNARDAMPRGGTLTIETANVELDAAYCAEHAGAVPGAHVMLAVSDTGMGMDRETQNRIFEPFFTTKEHGKGTGLGLSTVLGIVQQSGGSIWVYSEIGKGATFKVYLPAAPYDTIYDRAEGTATPLPTGNETILLVEDDEQLRSLTNRILSSSGFRVLSAADGEDALRVEASYGDEIQLVLTDVVMPRMSGRELVEHLTKRRPRIRVVYMSGYTDDTVVRHGVLDADISFLQKPLTPDTLTRKVREVLDADG